MATMARRRMPRAKAGRSKKSPTRTPTGVNKVKELPILTATASLGPTGTTMAACDPIFLEIDLPGLTPTGTTKLQETREMARTASPM